MLRFERRNPNVDLVDTYNLKNVKISGASIYTGNTNVINERKKLREKPPQASTLAAAVIGVNNVAASLSDLVWTDIDAQSIYLKTKPTCYLILSKPSAGAFRLGEEIAKKMQCIHLCPMNIITDEIDQKSPTGKTLEYNLRNNKVCSFDIILKMLRKKMNSEAVKHRGYVLSGFPLVSTTTKPQTLLKPLLTEDAYLVCDAILFDMVRNLKKKKPKEKLGTSSSGQITRSSTVPWEQEEQEEEEEQVEEEQQLEEGEEDQQAAELPKFVLDPCSDVITETKYHLKTHQAILLEQLDEIFNCDLKPDVILYITCPDKDLITKRSQKFVNYKTGQIVVEPFDNIASSDLRWPSHYKISDYEDSTKNDSFLSKYNCKQPINFYAPSVKQMCNYRNHVYNYIEKKLNDYDKKMIIKLDGRTSLGNMMHQVNRRLTYFRTNPVIIPQPLYLEEPPEDMEEFWTFVEEYKPIKADVVTFNRYASLWLNRCPVELKKRHTVIGKPKYAVQMFKHIYMMSSQDNFISFCRNPRPFLKIKYLEPTCRVIILGMASSGKTMIAECLSWLFDTPIIRYLDLLDNVRKRKHLSYSKTILSELIATIEDTRFADWQRMELDRVTALNEWQENVLRLLQEYLPILVKWVSHNEKQVIEKHPALEEVEFSEIEEEGLDPDVIKRYNQLREQLNFFPILNDMHEIEKLLKSQKLEIFAPTKLTTAMPEPSIPVIGDNDVTKAISDYIAANELQKELEPTAEELSEELLKDIHEIDTKVQSETDFRVCYGKYIVDGFSSDALCWDIIAESKLLPDYTIALIENKEIDEELFEHYIELDKKGKNYQKIFLSTDDPLIHSKLKTITPKDCITMALKMILNELLNNLLQEIDIQEQVEPPENYLQTFTESIEKFREDWDSIKIKLEETSLCYIEVELETKTDIEIIEEVLLNMRKCYMPIGERSEEDELDSGDNDVTRNPLSYNYTQFLCETKVYCPFTYYKYGFLWEGKPEFSFKYNNKLHKFCNEEFLEQFEKDVTKYQNYNNPYNPLPPMKICIIGCVGSGTTSVSKHIAKELGLIHIDYKKYLVNHVMPRHYKKVGRLYENPFTDEAIDDESVVEFQQVDEENEDMDIVVSEKELRRYIYNYFENGDQILPGLMQKVNRKIWFEIGCASTGFVIDGYPRTTNDFEDMMASFGIPDLVIQLEGTIESSSQRIVPTIMKQWKAQLNDAKKIARLNYEKVRQEWADSITQTVVIKLIIEEILDTIFLPLEPLRLDSDISTIIDANPFGLENVDPILFTTYNELIEQNPEPEDTTEWERYDDVKERYEARIEATFDIDYDHIQMIKDMFLEQNIECVTVDATKSFEKVTRKVLSELSHLRQRDEDSFLEQTFIVKPDVAELLLSQGFYFISHFNRMCPVYMYENRETINNPYLIFCEQGTMFPVIHRAYIYFIGGEASVIKFRKSPIKYISCDAIKYYLEYPLRLAIIGPPKSGKSVMAAKIAKRNGLLCISRGTALRNILENMFWTELGTKINKTLLEGGIIDGDLITKAVQMSTIDYRTYTSGYVFDGFPYNAFEAAELDSVGLFPDIILDISATKEKIAENSQNEIYNDILKYNPPYSIPFIQNMFTEWENRSYKVRDWIKDDYQNIYVLNGKVSRWKCLQSASVEVEQLTRNIRNYIANVDKTVVPVISISNAIFQTKMSKYRNLCPICFRNKVLEHNGNAKNKKGVVQFQDTFYWICDQHLDMVLRKPDYHLKTENVNIPEIPAVVKTFNMNFVYENGVCIVTYAENLPNHRIIKGVPEFIASYNGCTYMFCTQTCLHKFLQKPQNYFDIKVYDSTKGFPKLCLKNLPNLGYLEQTFANILTDACCSVNVMRPKYPGLSFQLSAYIYIGLYVKTRNPNICKDKLPMYVKALKVFEARCRFLTKICSRIRSMDNPFARYPKCYHNPPQYYPRELLVPEGVPVPDERFDYLCEFHKPASKVPAFLNVVDIAGLVRGAAEGQGLGNAFLSHIKACDAIFNLCRAFDDEDVIHVDGDVNPVRDLETIGEELRLKDEEQLMQNFEKLDRVVSRGGDKKLKPEYDALTRIKAVLVDEKKHIRFGDWSAADIEILNKYLFLTSKPALYLVNLSEKDYIRKKNKWLPKLKEWIDKNDPGAALIPFSGALESKLMDMDAQERQAYLKEHNITSALDKIIVQGYKALQLEYFFTAGPDEVKAWTIQRGAKAPQAAGRIHTDFEKGFIMAEVMHYKDFKEEGTEAACKSAGKYRQQGRNYVVEDGDIIFFKFNAGAGLKDAKKK